MSRYVRRRYITIELTVVVLTSPRSLLESNAPGERCLNATESMAKILFSYHQVPSCYLNLLISHHSFGIDENYGAFFGHSTLKVLGREAPELGRSGRHIHVSYALRTTLLYVGERELAARELLSDRQIAKRAAHDWLKPKVAIHHQFDVVSGKAVWFITTSMKPDPEINGRYKPILWGEHLRDFFKQQADSEAFQQPHLALDSSLQVHLILAQWTLGNLSDFLRFSEETLSQLVSDILYPGPSLVMLGTALNVNKLTGEPMTLYPDATLHRSRDRCIRQRRYNQTR